jgi:hypothetical protein
LPDWQGKKHMNIRSDNVFKSCKRGSKKAAGLVCDGIDQDSMGRFLVLELATSTDSNWRSTDAYSNSGGVFEPDLNEDDAAAFVKKLAAEARKYNMATGLKNAEQILSTVRDDVHSP